MTDERSDLLAERVRIRDEIARWTSRRRQLEVAKGEFLHQARRVRDGLERLGGRSFELETQAKALAGNRKMTEKDLQRAEAALQALERRLAEIAAALARLDGA